MSTKPLALASFALLAGCADSGRGTATISQVGDQVVATVCMDPGDLGDCHGESEQLTLEHDGVVTPLAFVDSATGHTATVPAGSSAPFTIHDGGEQAVIAMPAALALDFANATDYAPHSMVHVTWPGANQAMAWSYAYGCSYGANDVALGEGDGGALADNGEANLPVDTVLAAAQHGISQPVQDCLTTLELTRTRDGEPGFLGSAIGVTEEGVIVEID